MEWPRTGIAALALCALLAACNEPRVPDVALRFVRDGRRVSSTSLRSLAEHAPARVVSTDDPYYGRPKRFRAMPLAPILEEAFGESVDELRAHSFVLRARDGYAVPIEGRTLLEGGAFVAFDDVDVPGFAPIGPQGVSPAPAYLVWTRPGQSDLATHPRPWQLASIEIAAIETIYPHVVPTGADVGSDAMLGFRIFRDRCIRCHAINREGGRVGPDLNVPRSIVEYRSEEQIRQYVRDPTAFRYGAMPPHRDLTDAQLDQLLAYLREMSTRKHDPGPGGAE